MTSIHLVRHGRPIVDQQPRYEWPLDPSTLDDITRLRDSGVLPHDARWFTSPERRAVETSAHLGHPEATVMPDLHEQIRPGGLVYDLGAAVARTISAPDDHPLPGWESARSTTDRLLSAVAPILDRLPIVLVGHGLAWTLLSAHLTGVDPKFETWQSLRMPDHCTVTDGSFSSSWGEWAVRVSPCA